MTRASVARLKSVTAAILIASQLAACAEFPRPHLQPSVTSVPDPRAKTAFDEGSESSLDIDAGFNSSDVFMLRPINEVGNIPDIQVPPTSMTESGIYDALRLIVKNSGLTLNIEGGAKGSESYGQVSVFNVKGNLREVLEELSENMGFFYSVRKNTLFIQQDGQFIVELPPALSDDNMAGLTNTLQYLGAKDPYIDRMNRSLVFRTNRKSLAKIEAYLDKIRETRSLIIYDINIFQVDLTDNADTGIAWNALNYASSPSGSINTGGSTGGTTPSSSGSGAASAVGAMIGSAAQATATGLGLGLVLSSSKFSVDMLINFLKTQGSLKALSRPRLAVISGTKGSIRVGQATTYVSKVGSSATNLVNQVTTETKDLRTGVDLGLFGDYSDNTVYTRIGLSISEIIRLNKFTALGTDLTLPQTADREINTVVRARPGDMILLGGITIERDSMDVSKGATVNTSAKQVERSELVLALKTKIVNFRPKKPKTVAAAPVIPVEPPKPAPVAIVLAAPVVQAPPPPAPAPIAAAIVVVKKPEPELGLPAYAVLAPTAAGAVITDPVLNVPREFRTGGRLPSGEVIVSINGQNGEVTTDKRVIRMAE